MHTNVNIVMWLRYLTMLIYYLSVFAFSAIDLYTEAFLMATFFLSSIRLCNVSPRGLLAIALTAVNGIAEKTTTPASYLMKNQNRSQLKNINIQH